MYQILPYMSIKKEALFIYTSQAATWDESFSFTIAREAASYGRFMTDSDLNLWGLIVVPVGLTICFGLALLVWLRDELRAGPEDEKRERR
jgi:hypothetical protein